MARVRGAQACAKVQLTLACMSTEG